MKMSEASQIRKAAAETIDTSFNPDFLLESIVCDLHWSTLHIGAIGALIGARLKSEAEWTLRPYRHLFHDDSRIMQLALRYCEEIRIDASVGGAISRLYQTTSIVKLSTLPAVQMAKSYNGAEIQLLRQSAPKWRQLGLDAIQCLTSLEAQSKGRLAPQYSDDTRTLCRFLAESARDASGHVSAFGEVRLPELSQRRHSPRVGVNTACRIVIDGAPFAAVLEDVSRDGLGLRSQRPVTEGMRLDVELRDGRRLAGTVVRQRGEQVGLTLARSLASDDPLFRAQARGSTRA